MADANRAGRVPRHYLELNNSTDASDGNDRNISTGYWQTTVRGEAIRMDTEAELAEVQRKIRNTGSYPALVTPDELTKYLLDNRLVITEQTGVVYSPFADKWTLSSDMDVNYMVVAEGMV